MRCSTEPLGHDIKPHSKSVRVSHLQAQNPCQISNLVWLFRNLKTFQMLDYKEYTRTLSFVLILMLLPEQI